MPRTGEEQLVMDILDGNGFRVSRVAEGTCRTCDLIATDEHHTYLIEVKARTDSEEIRKTLANGRVFSDSQDTYYSNRVSDIVDEAITQLDTVGQTTPHDFRILWIFACTTYSREVTFDQICGTLYGMSEILWAAPDGKAASKQCLFFRNSSFHKHPQLDAAVVCEGHSGLLLCVNSFSSGSGRFRNSKFYDTFAGLGGVFEPEEEETTGRRFLADCDLDRDDEQAVLEYVKRKYALSEAWHVPRREHSATVAVPKTRNRRT